MITFINMTVKHNNLLNLIIGLNFIHTNSCTFSYNQVLVF